MTLIWHVPILFGPFFSLRVRLLSEQSGDSFPASDWSQHAVEPELGLWLADTGQMWDSQTHQSRQNLFIVLRSVSHFSEPDSCQWTFREFSRGNWLSPGQQRWELQTDLNTLFVTLSSHNFQSQRRDSIGPYYYLLFQGSCLPFLCIRRFQNLGHFTLPTNFSRTIDRKTTDHYMFERVLKPKVLKANFGQFSAIIYYSHLDFCNDSSRFNAAS